MYPVVTTRLGRLEGREEGGVAVFRGIPYARPPVGIRRLRPPMPCEPWQGARLARRHGPSAPQAAPVARFIQAMIGAGESAQSEDCLYLNVWTPAADRGRRPVMVWLHGGAFVMGSSSTLLYDGRQLARRGNLVVVTLNYRLGALGFLDLKAVGGGPEAPSNLGLLDQIEALRFVRDHIEVFGGDPEQVTIFGESAGGMSVGTLLGTPRARGLFQRAILQSGAAHNVSSRAQARRVAENLLAKLRIDPDHPERLWSLDPREILAAQRATTFELGLGLGTLPWQPSVDADVLPRPPLEALANAEAAGVATLVGSNLDEWSLFMLGDRRGRRMDEAMLRRRLARALPGTSALGVPLAERAYAAYRRSLRKHDSTAPRERWVSFQSDRIFHVPAVRLADLQSEAGAPTWSYLFSWAPPVVSRWVGACHGLEIPFVFGTLAHGALRPSLALVPAVRRLQRQLQDAWIAFARCGEPGHADLPDWPKADALTRPTMNLDVHCRVDENPHARGVEFWRELL